MERLQKAILTTAAHFSRIAVALLVLKMIAIHIGPDGLGKLGNFMSAVTLLAVLGGGGIINALIKYTSEYQEDIEKQANFLYSAMRYSFLFCVISSFAIIIFSAPISMWIFGDVDKYFLIVFLAIGHLGISITNFSTGFFNGKGNTSAYCKTQIFGSSIAIPVCFCLIAYQKFTGSAIAFLVVYVAPSIPALYLMLRGNILSILRSVTKKNDDAGKLFAFTIMSLASAITFPLTEIIVRNILVQDAGYENAGIWQGSIKLSATYLGFFGVFLAYYFMPKISRLKEKKKIAQETYSMCYFVAVAFIVGAGVFYFKREFLIGAILSDEFSPLSDYIIYQLIGDFFKLICYVIGFVIVAKAAAKLYIFGEFFQNGLFLILINSFHSHRFYAYDLMKIYAVSYFIYFIISFVAFFIYINHKSKKML